MRILQVIPYFTPKRGGDVNVCYNISKHLVKHGHQVTIITTNFEFDNEFAQNAINEGIEIISFHCSANIFLYLISPSMKKWLDVNLQEFDVIHMHNFRSYQNNIVHKYAKKYNVPYVLQAHGDIPYLNIKNELKRIFDNVYGYSILKNANKLMALSKREKNDFLKMTVIEDKIEIIPNGIDLSEYESLPGRGHFRNKYHIKDNEKIILYLGRIHQTKGIDLLIAAYSELVKDLLETRLVIVGPDDGYLSELKNQTTELGIEDKVLFTGPLFNRDKLTAYIDADVFVTPKYSGLPVTFIEACACGIPIITTTEGDDIDWINNNVGFVVEYSVSSICQAIIKLLHDDKLRSRFGNKGKDLVRDKLNWDKIVAKIEENVY
jgi:glycosyltransferase involved in cell wall biosynthesis